jgi:hypothetical protein
MKTLILIAIIFWAASNESVFAQNAGGKLYWVIETNTVKRDVWYLKFYDERDRMVHEIKIENKIIDISRRRDKRMLDDMLRRYSNSITSTGKKSKTNNQI